VASFFEVTVRTAGNYLEQNDEELVRNGYEVLKGKRLKKVRLSIQQLDVPEIDFGNIRESENISYHVAAGSISKELLGEWMSAILRGNEDNEVLKLKILNAISKGEL
jgi:hypothetical protein